MSICYNQGVKKIGLILLVLALGYCGWLIYDNWDWMNANFFHHYSPLPDFRLQDYLEKYHSASEFRGIPLVINLWAADDAFSAEELKELANAQEEFGDKIVVIGINRGESLNTAKNFTDKLGVSSQIFILLDPEDSFYKAIVGFKMTETIFVDKKGNIVDHKRGSMKLPEIRQRVERIL